MFGSDVAARMVVAVCEDNKGQREGLSALVSEWAELLERNCVVREYADARAFLFHMGSDGPFDILFLDINMGGGMDGMDLAKRVREGGLADVIVFATAMEGYAVGGYKVQAYDFLLKPVEKQDVFAALDYAWGRRAGAAEEVRVVLYTEAGRMLVNARDILYVEASRHYVDACFADGRTERLKNTITELEEMLPGDRFVRTHRSFIVNIEHVSHFAYGNATLQGGIAVPIGRKWQDYVNKRLADV